MMDELQFNSETHSYSVNGKELISVTQLLQKHGLTPDYSGVEPDVLKSKAERGSLIHAEIEEFIKEGKVGMTKELESFIDFYNRSPMVDLRSEVKLHNDIVAGTCDLLFKDKNGDDYIADFKTTYGLHRDSVSWQLSLYNYLDGWKAKAGYAFHFKPTGELDVVPIPLKPKEEVEKLLECERKGELYHRQFDLLTPNQLSVLESAQAVIEEAKKMEEFASKQMEQVQSALLKAMEENAVTSFETDHLKIKYVAPYSRVSFDTAKLKSEMPEIAAKYQKTSEVKATVRISLKD